jgi:spore coat polysaccharide biosynthesis protein SpsF (cytidylyltransferase family)
MKKLDGFVGLRFGSSDKASSGWLQCRYTKISRCYRAMTVLRVLGDAPRLLAAAW